MGCDRCKNTYTNNNSQSIHKGQIVLKRKSTLNLRVVITNRWGVMGAKIHTQVTIHRAFTKTAEFLQEITEVRKICFFSATCESHTGFFQNKIYDIKTNKNCLFHVQCNALALKQILTFHNQIQSTTLSQATRSSISNPSSNWIPSCSLNQTSNDNEDMIHISHPFPLVEQLFVNLWNVHTIGVLELLNESIKTQKQEKWL